MFEMTGEKGVFEAFWQVVLKKPIALIFHLLPPTKKLKESNKEEGF
jgi:hypothetical protein